MKNKINKGKNVRSIECNVIEKDIQRRVEMLMKIIKLKVIE